MESKEPTQSKVWYANQELSAKWSQVYLLVLIPLGERDHGLWHFRSTAGHGFDH